MVGGPGRTHEQVVGIWNIAAYSEELHEVMVLAVDITAYLEAVSDKGDWEIYYMAVRTVTGAVTVTTLPSSISSSRAL